MRRKKMLVFFVLVLVIALSGCTSSANDTNKGTASVENSTMDAGTETDSSENRANESQLIDTATTTDSTQEDSTGNTTSNVAEVDYDLTSMSSDMVYALVYQMLYNPDTYIGKTVRMSGQYYASYYSETKQYYHYCIIADATSCCSQGMEFVQGESALVYPDDYPENETEIIVVGTFGTYEELGITYCCLLDASMKEAE